MKPFFEALISMPMVLPPSVIGYYMLVIYSPRNWFGSWLGEVFNIRLAFTFEGILIASVIFSLPFMVQPLHNGLRSLPDSLREASYTLGKSKLQTLYHIILPNIKSYIALGVLTTFAHTMGEFGVVLMVGGNIPGETKVLSIALFEKVEELDYATAHAYSLVLILTSLLIKFRI